jgi:GTP-binding nuclear protein Ran
MELTQFKIVLVGDGKVGKTAFVKKLLTNEFESKYVPTLGVEIYSLYLNTNYYGVIDFNIWDCAGVEKYGGLREGYYHSGDGFIVMYDVNDENPAKTINKWGDSLREKLRGKPGVVCANKCDEGANAHKKYNHIYISVKEDYNLFAPILSLARDFTGHDDLEFVEW